MIDLKQSCVRSDPMATASGEEPLPCAGEIFLWCLDLRRLELAPLLPFLSLAECRVASMGKRFGTNLEERLKSRDALRGILSACTGRPALSFAFACRRGQEPDLPHDPLGLQFSVSRSCEHALIGIGRAALGVDIEAVRPDCAWQMIAAHWFHPRERARIAAAPAAEQRDLFFQIWAHKEAFIKGVGTGPGGDAIMSCATMPEGRITGDGTWPAGSSWHLQSLKAPPGYKASLATSGKPPCIIDRTASFARTLALACRHFPERSRTIMNIPDVLPQPATVGTMSC